jgi:hypothetical protein
VEVPVEVLPRVDDVAGLIDPEGSAGAGLHRSRG